MKKTLACALILGTSLLGHPEPGRCERIKPVEFWVAPDGADTNPGTREQPLASVSIALRKARELRRLTNAAVAHGARIILRGGVYRLTSPVLIRPEDSGTATGPTVIEAAPGERPVLSGGVEVTGWRKLTEKIPGLPKAAQKNVWVADPPQFCGRIVESRQLWVNGRKAVRAREPNGEAMHRLIAWDRQKQEAWIPAAPVRALRRTQHLEMIFHQQWEIAVCRVKTLRVEGDKACVTFHDPEGPIQFEHPWPQPVMTTNYASPFVLANAIEFLDAPGEWFQELPSGRIFYWPRANEEMTQARAVVPALETLVHVSGSLDRPVQHVHFRGITFAHTSWLRPSYAGHVPLQAGMYLLDAYKLVPKGTPEWRSLDNQAWIGRPPGAVTVRAARNIRFEQCAFEHLASAGLDAEHGVQDSTIECCLFRDIGGNGIQLGKFSDPGIETHLPYNPADDREVCARIRIANNFVTDTANEDWGCVGICVGFAREVTIAHNEVSNTSYTGISVGWGWTRATNCMRDNIIHANHIHHVATRMCDTAGIYTLSCQPGTVISENFIHDIHMSPYVHDPNHWFYIYLDEGSSYITVRDNWCPEEKFLSNAVGPGNVWERNGPTAPEKVRQTAGPEPHARALLGEMVQ
ncbi:MAG: right-handed parallel beta-helix repeat-containing protein [Verrucomicrobiae bacterium]|nr:right-handed parallel beta-helix repeat-containing protein [Verrucomicrobiae bacterium]